MKLAAGVCAKPYDIAGIWRDFRFEQDYMKHGEIWRATSDIGIKPKEKVIVRKVLDSLVLFVEPYQK